MRVLLLHSFDHNSARQRYQVVARRLNAAGHEATAAIGVPRLSLRPFAFQALVTHGTVRRHWNLGPRCLGGRGWSRPRVLRELAADGVPVMPWARALDRRGVLRLFYRWGARRLLLKRSFTCGGAGVAAFERSAVDRLRWRPWCDLFCPEINENEGSIYKIEACNGAVTIAWVSHAPPLKDVMDGEFHIGGAGAYGDRSLLSPPPTIRRAVENCSRRWAGAGVGYASFDFMRTPEGAWVAIEANTELVATWWTARFPEVAERYAVAVQDWLEGE